MVVFCECISFGDLVEHFSDHPIVADEHVEVVWEVVRELKFADTETLQRELDELRNQVVDYLMCLEQFPFVAPKYVGRTRTYFKGFVDAAIDTDTASEAAEVLVTYLNRLKALH